jgi:hypothetical protein
MNKKFIGATAVTVVTVAGLVYYRHILLKDLDQRLYDVLSHMSETLEESLEEEEDPDAAA